MNLVIQAGEGGFYITRLTDETHSDQGLKARCKQQGLTYQANMRFNNLGHIREYFSPLKPNNVWLEHNCAYDEMIGLPCGETAYRQPLYWYSAMSPTAKSA